MARFRIFQTDAFKAWLLGLEDPQVRVDLIRQMEKTPRLVDAANLHNVLLVGSQHQYWSLNYMFEDGRIIFHGVDELFRSIPASSDTNIECVQKQELVSGPVITPFEIKDYLINDEVIILYLELLLRDGDAPEILAATSYVTYIQNQLLAISSKATAKSKAAFTSVASIQSLLKVLRKLIFLLTLERQDTAIAGW